MSELTENQPMGTPTWIDLTVPDLDRAMGFYRALFGWDYAVETTADGRRAIALLRRRPVAGMTESGAPGHRHWTMYLATDDCDATAGAVTAAGGSLVTPPTDVADVCRVALAKDPTGALFGLWQGRSRIGCEVVNEPSSLVRNDLVTPEPEPARAFYAAVFGYTLDGNDDLPGMDFTFLRRPDGKEIGGILGSAGGEPAWSTTFEVADTPEVVERAAKAGGTAGAVEDSPYGRFATLVDPCGAELSVIARY